MTWNITKVEVLNPIRWISVRRNEVGRKAATPTARQMAGEKTTPLGFYIEEERQLRAGLFLRDVRYRIYGYFDLISPDDIKSNNGSSKKFRVDGNNEKQNYGRVEAEAKYAAMFERRAEKGQCFHRPYLGCREFPCFFKLVDLSDIKTKPIEVTQDLGYMLYDLDFSSPNDPVPMFFRAKMKNGVIKTDRRRIEVVK